ncbi:hypothetical protein Dimus_015915 [Dionaea muscipula]
MGETIPARKRWASKDGRTMLDERRSASDALGKGGRAMHGGKRRASDALGDGGERFLKRKEGRRCLRRRREGNARQAREGGQCLRRKEAGIATTKTFTTRTSTSGTVSAASIKCGTISIATVEHRAVSAHLSILEQVLTWSYLTWIGLD